MSRLFLVGLIACFAMGYCLGQEDEVKSKGSFESVKEMIHVALEKQESLLKPEIREFMKSADAGQKKEILNLVLQEMRSLLDAGEEYHNLLKWFTSEYDCGASVAEQEGLYSTLLDIVKRGDRRNRQRALRALMYLDPRRKGDQELVHDLFREAGCVVLQLAILWDIQSDFLDAKARACVNRANQGSAQNQVLEIYPYAIINQYADEIEKKWEYPFDEKLLDLGLIANKWDYWGGFYFRPEKVKAHDLALAYMAWMGDESAKRKLDEAYNEAPDPKGMRDVEDKDKRYWYMLLCLVEIPDDHPPKIPKAL